MVHLGDDLGLEQQNVASGQFPDMSTLRGFENAPLDSTHAFEYNNTKRINDYSIEEPFTNISNTYDNPEFVSVSNLNS